MHGSGWHGQEPPAGRPASAVEAGKYVRYFTATKLAKTLYRGLAENSVGRMIKQILKAPVVMINEIGLAPLNSTTP